MTAGFATVAWEDVEVDVAVHCIELHIGFCQKFLDEGHSVGVSDIMRRKITIMWSLVTSLREAQATAKHEREALGMNDPPRELSEEDLREASEASN